MKKIIKRILSAILCAAALTTAAAAYEPVQIRLNGADTAVDALLIGSTTYVPFEAANALLSFGEAEVTGDASSMRSVSGSVTVSARAGDCYVEASGRYLGGSDVVEISGMLYVPVRSLAKAYDADVAWTDATRTVDLIAEEGSAITPGSEFYREDEVFWLARIIHAESQGEPLAGKILVGNVVMNRVASREFPDTIYGVIFDRKWGVQFTPVANGTIYNTPGEESILAAKLVLDGYSLAPTALYFLNPREAQNFWVPQNRPYLMSVGCHDFYA